MPRGL